MQNTGSLRPSRRRVVLDAMGGDKGVAPNVSAALSALKAWDFDLTLAGDEKIIRSELLRQNGGTPSRLEILHASEVVTMEDSAVAPLRQKKDSSIRRGIDLIKDGHAQAFVSAGHTGACMAAAKVVLGAVEGVDRPAIAAPFPCKKGPSLILDVGANLNCKAHHLRQFAVMGSIYSNVAFGVERPRVGLLNIGQEDNKGNDLTKEVFEVLQKTPLNFVGNVEGRDLFLGDVDVMVCDGFIGNIVLKMGEGLGEAVGDFFRDAFVKNPLVRLGGLLSRSVYRDFKRRMDYAEYGGAPLLGVHDVVIICHGRSNARALKNGLRVALECIDKKVSQRTRQDIETLTQMEHDMENPLFQESEKAKP